MYIPSFSLLTNLAELVLSTSGHGQKLYPNHDVLKLSDGHYIPSPAFGVGSALYQKNATEDVVLALKNGYRHIDNAYIYGNEASVGEALKIAKVPREELYITSKYDAIDGEDVRTEFKKSIKLLGVDYLDLYLIHFPAFADAGGGIKKVWREFEKLKDEGLVKSIGVSNYGVVELTELLLLAKHKPTVNQIRYHAYNAEENKATVAFAALNDIVIEAYGSLAPITKVPGGPADAVGERIADRISTVAGGIKVTVAQAILDWIKTKKFVAVTTSGKDFRQKEQLQVFQKSFPPLTGEEIADYEAAGAKGEKKE